MMKNVMKRFKEEEFSISWENLEEYEQLMKIMLDNGIEKWIGGDKVIIERHHGYEYPACSYSATYCALCRSDDKAMTFKEFMEEYENFTMSDLDVGMVVKHRDNWMGIVLKDDKGLFACNHNGHIRIDDKNYNYDLTMKRDLGNSLDDIVAVYKFAKGSDFCLDRAINNQMDCLELIWERQEVKEVTIEEIEEMYGCKVKIVKG